MLYNMYQRTIFQLVNSSIGYDLHHIFKDDGPFMFKDNFCWHSSILEHSTYA